MGAESSRVDDLSAKPLRGVALLQLAAVHAAVAEGFALEQVLELEGLPQLAWFEAELSWKARLTSDGDLFERYQQVMAKEQDRLARPVSPLDSDMKAWVAFLRVYGSHEAPFELLSNCGLGLNDLARLSRRWGSRFDADAKLAKRAAKLADKLESRWQRKGELPELPAVVIGKPQLLASALAGTFVSRDLPSAGEAEAPVAAAPLLGLDRYAALIAELELAGDDDRGAVLTRFELDEDGTAAIDEAWRARLDSDAELRADFRFLTAHYQGAAAMRRRSSKQGQGVSAPRVANAATSPTPPPLPARPAPAFSGSVPPWRPTARGPLQPLASDPPLSVDRTAVAVPMLRVGEALPFSGSAEAPSPAAAGVASSSSRMVDNTSAVIPTLRDAEVTPFDPLGATSAGIAVVSPPRASSTQLPADAPEGRGRFITLPFAGSRPWLPVATSSAAAELDLLGGTATLIPTLLEVPVLPFSMDEEVEEERDDDAITRRRVAADPPTVKRRAEPDELDTTHLVPVLDLEALTQGDGAAQDGQSAAQERIDETAGPSVTAEPSVPAEPSVTAEPSVPRLTLEQLASFHAEMAQAESQPVSGVDGVRARYHLANEAAQRVLEESWRRHFVSHPSERARYERLLRKYRAWLRGH